jgi:hypothetical protein
MALKNPRADWDGISPFQGGPRDDAYRTALQASREQRPDPDTLAAATERDRQAAPDAAQWYRFPCHCSVLDALLSALDDPVRAALQRHGLLLPLVEKELVADCVSAITVEAELADQLLQAFLQRHELSDPARLQALIEEGSVDLEQLRWQSQLQYRIERYCDEHFGHQAETRFLQRKHNLDRVVYSLLRCKDPYLARELYLRIQEGEANFADLAAEHSQGHEKTTKGIVGPVPLNQAHPLLAERLRVHPPGTLIEPFSIESWWLVVRLESFQSASFDSATRQQMARELFDEWVNEEAKRRLLAVLPPAGHARPVAISTAEG